jgi:hypothetical protein
VTGVKEPFGPVGVGVSEDMGGERGGVEIVVVFDFEGADLN